MLELIRLEKRTKYLRSENYSLGFREFTAAFKYIYYSLFNIINPVPWNLFSFDEGFLSFHWFAAFCVSKSIIHLFQRGTIFRFRHFTVLFFAFKESIKDPPLRNTETAASETRWERKEQLYTHTNKLLTCKIWKKKKKRFVIKCHCLSSFLCKQKRSNLFVLSPSQDLLLDSLKVDGCSSQ